MKIIQYKNKFIKALILILLFCNCKGKRSNETVVNSYQSAKNIKSKIIDQSNIISYLPNNYSTRGDIDYTKELQLAFNENKKIIMPNFPIAVNYNGVIIPSNRVITFQSNSSLIVLPNDKQNYQALLISENENIILYNPRLKGERDFHKNKDGEWGMGIKILSSSNIKIYNADIKNFWGDGIYVGRIDKGLPYCNNILIKGGILDNNRRNGISIITAKNTNVEDITIKNTHGTNPMAGIDLEPNLKDEFLYNINLKNVTTNNNQNYGILIVFHKLINHNKILLNIDNHNNYGSTYPMSLVGVDNENEANFSGTINYSNAKWDNTNSQIYYERKFSKLINLNIGLIEIKNKFYDKSTNSPFQR
ncbi:right-handed parallel beta-helix repeat-containing protein [Empedobacter sp.]|uniref:right-handed parallel beta-helix repeat-containing protein n=1 Tax=Empedobacter sp. TaxID=1927715 RepID=UPI0028B1294F|nr:right-handed parallel beta-helix repeat-containing protein [Empedobacter sp.]